MAYKTHRKITEEQKIEAQISKLQKQLKALKAKKFTVGTVHKFDNEKSYAVIKKVSATELTYNILKFTNEGVRIIVNHTYGIDSFTSEENSSTKLEVNKQVIDYIKKLSESLEYFTK